LPSTPTAPPSRGRAVRRRFLGAGCSPGRRRTRIRPGRSLRQDHHPEVA